MTATTRLHCDRCGRETDWDTKNLDYEKGWTRCLTELKRLDFCPACWEMMLAGAKPPALEDTE
jgi:hypothetical protein